MAVNLLDAIRQNQQKGLQEATPVLENETQGIQQMLRARSGRVGTDPAVGQSNLQERQAVAGAQQQIQNVVQPQAAIQQAGLEQQSSEIAQQGQQQLQQVAQGRRFDDLQTKMRTEGMLKELERGGQEMDVKRRGAQLEQVASNLRLENKQYTDQLQLEGQKNRLDNQSQFQEALTRSILGNNQQLLQKQLGNKSILATTDREFRLGLEKMGLDSAYSMFRTEAAGAKQAGAWTAAGGVATTGVQAYGTYSDSEDRKELAEKRGK